MRVFLCLFLALARHASAAMMEGYEQMEKMDAAPTLHLSESEGTDCFAYNDEDTHRDVTCHIERQVDPVNGFVLLNFTNLSGYTNGNGYTIWMMVEQPFRGAQSQLFNLGGFQYVAETTPSTEFLFQVPDYVNRKGKCIESAPGRCVEYPAVTKKNDPNQCSIIFPEGCEDPESCNANVGLVHAPSSTKWGMLFFFKNHGRYDPNLYGREDMLGTFNGGCTSDSIKFPKDACPSGNQTCFDIAVAEYVADEEE